ncbi:GDSL-type esterase/lipase family protein [Flavitalea flava]
MNIFFRGLTGSLILSMSLISAYGQRPDEKIDPLKAVYISLNGQALTKGNKVEKDGTVRNRKAALLRLVRTTSSSPKGTILLIPGGGYVMLQIAQPENDAVPLLNKLGFDVAILDYSIAVGPEAPGRKFLESQLPRTTLPRAWTLDRALSETLKAFRLLRTGYDSLGLHGGRFGIMGISSGGHLAARTVQRLADQEQPDDQILLFPSNLDETIPGTVIPAIMPPLHPKGRLLAIMSTINNPSWITGCSEYVKVWKGYDGQAVYRLLNDSVTSQVIQLTQFLGSAGENNFTSPNPAANPAPNPAPNPATNPAAIPVAGYSPDRHGEKLKLVASHKYDLIMLGNSITNNFEKPEYQPVWQQFFAPRNAVNLGFSGYRTENLLWNIQNGELEGQSPKVVVLEIGTNNIDEKNYPTRHTAGELAGGIEAIVTLVRRKVPGAKILILRCFPGCYGGPNPTSHRAILERASDIVSRLADRKNVFYCDVNHVFLNLDGTIKHDLMPDWLHPSPAGAKAWAGYGTSALPTHG